MAIIILIPKLGVIDALGVINMRFAIQKNNRVIRYIINGAKRNNIIVKFLI